MVWNHQKGFQIYSRQISNAECCMVGEWNRCFHWITRPSKNIANGIDPENNNHVANAIHTEIFNSFT